MRPRPSPRVSCLASCLASRLASLPLLLLPLLSCARGARPTGSPPPEAAPRASAARTVTPEASPPLPSSRVPYLSPEESRKHHQLPPGYRLELALAEPVIREPVQIAFDGNGRMYVAEMRTYMQDIDGRGQKEPTSRVSRHERDADGRWTRHTVFADGLKLPRMLLALGDGELVIGETDTNDLFLYKDTDGDGVADRKEAFYEGGPRGGNLEHQPNGLLWGLDNWLYTTYNAHRLRWDGRRVVKQPTAPNGGQWGLAQDDDGKIWFSNASAERGLLNFQIHVAYGAVDLPAEQFEPGFTTVWPLVPIPDVQGGKKRFRPVEKTLNHFTGTCGHEIYRGDQLPAELRGDVLVSEPVGRLIRRARVESRGGLTYLRNAHPGSEFIRSTDPNFRPVNLATGPDGTLYIVDMYRGIIQEGNWVRRGSHLRRVVEEYGFDKNFGRGRIWRLVHERTQPVAPPRLYDEPSSALVARLGHANGWWRDMAQRILVLRKDRSVLPALAALARGPGEELARIHALWTLEGLGAVPHALLSRALRDESPRLRAHAVRVAESLASAGDARARKALLATAGDQDPRVALQAALSARRLALPGHERLLAALASPSAPAPSRAGAGSASDAAEGWDGLRRIALDLATQPGDEVLARFEGRDRRVIQRGRAIYAELCFACHGIDGRGAPVQGAPKGTTLAPSLVRSELVLGDSERLASLILHGLTGPVRGRTYPGLMVPMRDNDDAWIAAVSSYIRNAFGNRAPLVRPAEVARAREATRDRTEPWTLPELLASGGGEKPGAR